MATKYSAEVTIVNPLGLHARPAAKLAQLCQQFHSKIELIQDGKTADASSVLALLMLASSKGKLLEIVAEGDDACQALQAVVHLIASGFEES
ncbi:HPr family phosphocarrier protein [Alkalimonas mucilaginosa]|uniref:HPr family phosphocarrier protein n=1 Tax=Alkalimonas mucilaginosa TaxID=3057676 RepID=A0ABU7JDW1_9GAMM|nr:HPr family phosphocarrier protein [Alkalimonas sp. MEB004]MEE2023884.1 HPr family phosphocarrier protein [Alkalimonas sp. MEB004]